MWGKLLSQQQLHHVGQRLRQLAVCGQRSWVDVPFSNVRAVSSSASSGSSHLAANAAASSGRPSWPIPGSAGALRSLGLRQGHYCALGSGHVAASQVYHSSGGITALSYGARRWKQTKTQSYNVPARSGTMGQRRPNKAMLGAKATPSEYVEAGRLICKQRKFIPKNPKVTRNRHFKIYPGENVKVMKNTSLQAMVSGRIKMTHDVDRDVLIMNVLPEAREELLRDELWRYRTEHVKNLEENKHLCNLRAKALPAFGKEGGWLNPPDGVRPVSCRVGLRRDSWNNPFIKDPLELEPFAYAMPRSVLERHIRKVRRQQQGLPDNDPDFHIVDTRFHLFRGQTAQR